MAKKPNNQADSNEIAMLVDLVRGFNAWKWVFATLGSIIAAGLLWLGSNIYGVNITIAKLDGVPKKVDDLSNRLGGVDTELATIKANVESLKDVPDSIAKLTALPEALKNLEVIEAGIKQTQALPESVAAATNELNARAKELAALTGAFDQFKDAVAKSRQELSETHQRIDETLARIGELEKKILGQIDSTTRLISVQTALSEPSAVKERGQATEFTFRLVGVPGIPDGPIKVHSVDLIFTTEGSWPSFFSSAVSESEKSLMVTVDVENAQQFREFVQKSLVIARITITAVTVQRLCLVDKCAVKRVWRPTKYVEWEEREGDSST